MSSGTLCTRFRATVSRMGDATALLEDGRTDISWRQFAAQVSELAQAFHRLGLRAGDTVALLARNTQSFHVLDMALMHLGATPFSISGHEPADRVAQFLSVAECNLVLAEDDYLVLAQQAATARDGVTVIAVGQDDSGGAVLSLAVPAAHLDTSAGAQEPSMSAVGPEAVATLIFTSGSTGTPKAVQLSHRAICASLDSFHQLAPYGQGDDRFISYLPLSHIAERFMTYYSAVAFGGTIHCVTDADRLYDDIVQVRPTRFFGVPRVYEKLADRARARIGSDPGLTAALESSLEAVRTEQAGEQREGPQTPEAFRAVRAELGLDRTRYLGVATAPSGRELLEFFLGIGLPVGDIWGLSEAIMCTANPVGRIRLGTVGVFLNGVEGTVTDDGELLVRGPNVFSGYKGDPERTAELVDSDGWVHTGDLGVIDADGYLSIIGRKKEVMITATGKNLMPAVIESAVKSASPLIDHVLSIADGRRYVTALISLDRGQLEQFAGENGLTGSFTQLAKSPLVQAAIAEAVQRANGQLSRPETVRAWQVVEHEWLPGGDEITSTMKVRRQEICRRYSAEIDGLYR